MRAQRVPWLALAIGLGVVVLASSASAKPRGTGQSAGPLGTLYDVATTYGVGPQPNIQDGTLKIMGPGVSSDPTQNGQWGITWTSVAPFVQVVGYVVEDPAGTPYQGSALPTPQQIAMSIAYHKKKNGLA